MDKVMDRSTIVSDLRFQGITPFEKKIWLSSLTLHGEEFQYVKEAMEANWG